MLVWSDRSRWFFFNNIIIPPEHLIIPTLSSRYFNGFAVFIIWKRIKIPHENITLSCVTDMNDLYNTFISILLLTQLTHDRSVVVLFVVVVAVSIIYLPSLFLGKRAEQANRCGIPYQLSQPPHVVPHWLLSRISVCWYT